MNPGKKSRHLRIDALCKSHDRSAFSCTTHPQFEIYLKRTASQDKKRNLAVPFVLLKEGTQTVIGFYTLSSCTIRLVDLPEQLGRKLPSGRTIPATLLGQLAVDDGHRGQRLGVLMLIDALRRASEHAQQIASYAVVVDAVDQGAASFYSYMGFVRLPDTAGRLFLPMATVYRLF